MRKLYFIIFLSPFFENLLAQDSFIVIKNYTNYPYLLKIKKNNATRNEINIPANNTHVFNVSEFKIASGFYDLFLYPFKKKSFSLRILETLLRTHTAPTIKSWGSINTVYNHVFLDITSNKEQEMYLYLKSK